MKVPLTEIRRRAHEREVRAFQLRQDGLTYRAIGEQFGVGKMMARVLVFRGEYRTLAMSAGHSVEQLSKAQIWELVEKIRPPTEARRQRAAKV